MRVGAPEQHLARPIALSHHLDHDERRGAAGAARRAPGPARGRRAGVGRATQADGAAARGAAGRRVGRRGRGRRAPHRDVRGVVLCAPPRVGRRGRCARAGRLHGRRGARVRGGRCARRRGPRAADAQRAADVAAHRRRAVGPRGQGAPQHGADERRVQRIEPRRTQCALHVGGIDERVDGQRARDLRRAGGRCRSAARGAVPRLGRAARPRARACRGTRAHTRAPRAQGAVAPAVVPRNARCGGRRRVVGRAALAARRAGRHAAARQRRPPAPPLAVHARRCAGRRARRRRPRGRCMARAGARAPGIRPHHGVVAAHALVCRQRDAACDAACLARRRRRRARRAVCV